MAIIMVKTSQLVWDATAFTHEPGLDLIMSIKARGFLQDHPITVAKIADNYFLVVGGRWVSRTAVRLYAIAELPAVVIENAPENIASYRWKS